MDYTEEWNLGVRLDNNTITSTMEIYEKETNDTISRDIGSNPFVIVEERVSYFL